jgi:hypothetical protein
MYRQLEHSGPCVMIVEDNGNLKTQLSKPEKEIEKGSLTYLNVNACLHYDHYVHVIYVQIITYSYSAFAKGIFITRCRAEVCMNSNGVMASSVPQLVLGMQ